MAEIISSFLPFPNIAWWAHVANAEKVCLDRAEHFEKMSYRNRYQVGGANGLIQLSIPLEHGRNQRSAMGDMQISDKDKWQVNHWRTLTSVYRRAPYFEHYEHSLQPLFTEHYRSLTEFSLATIEWLREQCGYRYEIAITDEYIKEHECTDLRGLRPSSDKQNAALFPSYYQLFADRTGFLPNLSLLDLLFSEGPYTALWIKNHSEKILGG